VRCGAAAGRACGLCTPSGQIIVSTVIGGKKATLFGPFSVQTVPSEALLKFEKAGP